MNHQKIAITALAGLGLSACTVTEPLADQTVAADLNPCLQQVMAHMEGTFDYTGTIARISGGYRTFITQSTHMPREDGSWEYRSFGGDMEEPSASTVRLVGNQILTRPDEPDATEGQRTFTSCEGPNEVGRITTRSNYELPGTPDFPQTLFVDILALYGEEGAYFTETITNEDGDVVAYRSGVSVATE